MRTHCLFQSSHMKCKKQKREKKSNKRAHENWSLWMRFRWPINPLKLSGVLFSRFFFIVFISQRCHCHLIGIESVYFDSVFFWFCITSKCRKLMKTHLLWVCSEHAHAFYQLYCVRFKWRNVRFVLFFIYFIYFFRIVKLNIKCDSNWNWWRQLFAWKRSE